MTPLTADNWRRVPVTLLLLLLSAVGFLLVYLQAPLSWLSALTYSDFYVRGQTLVFTESNHQYWRLLTPVFLHFGWMHIVFNSLWVWELGGKLELRFGPWLLLALAVVLGVGSNSAQYWVNGPALFGGMSGVVFGLLGFSLVYGRLMRDPWLRIQNSIVFFMVGWLVFCMLAPTDLFGLGSIANTAHVSGLVAGCGLGLMFVGWKLAVKKVLPNRGKLR